MISIVSGNFLTNIKYLYTVKVLLPNISKQKDKILALITQAGGTLNSNQEEEDEEDMDPETIAEYEQTVNDFTTMTRDLNKQLELLAKVVRVHS